MDADRDREARLEGVLASAAVVLTLSLLVFLFLGRVFYKEWHLPREFEFDKLALVAIGMALLGVSLAGRRLGARVMLVAVASLSAMGAGLVAGVAASLDLGGRLKSATASTIYRAHASNIFAPDDRYEYVLRPNTHDRERTFDYDVTYSVDASGRRVTPTPSAPRATIVVTGDSFTFGTGVEDRDSYPYVLGERFWPDVKVVNAAVGGWGIEQALLTVTDVLSTRPLPDAIVYAMIPDDQFRSHLRAPIERGAEPAPALVEQELAMNRTLIAKMQRACADKHVSFALVLLQDEGRYPPDLVYAFAQDGIPIVDLTRLKYERFPHDYHPNAANHRRIAEALASSRIAAMVGHSR